jgi:hypothetical protein
MTKRLINIFCFILLTSITACKKYPENNLWFKRPSQLDFFNGHLTKYTVNGIDSLDLLNYYFGRGYGLRKDIRTTLFITQHEHTDHFGTYMLFAASYQVPFISELTKKNKFLKVNSVRDTNVYNKDLFISKDTEWQIIRLAKKGPFRIKTTLGNGNTYEMEITP